MYAEAVGVPHVIVNGVPIVADGQHTGALPGTILRSGEKFTVPASKTRFPWSSKLAVLAAVEANVSLVEKFSPNSAATLESSTSVRMYQRALFVPASATPAAPIRLIEWPQQVGCLRAQARR